MIVLGVDPGLSGGLAAINSETRSIVALFHMPVFQAAGKAHVNAPMLRDLLMDVMPERAFIESVSARPGQGVTSMFSFGRGLGVVEGVLGALLIPVEFITPQTWRGRVKLRGDKAEARGLATRTWPSHAGSFSKVKDDGKAEAALIALAAVMAMGRK